MAKTDSAPGASQPRRVASAAAGSPKKKKRWVTVLRWALTGVLVLVLAGVGGFAYLWMTTPIPDPNKDFLTINSHMYFNDGKTELGTLSVQNRDPVPYAEIPKTMTDAMVAAENPTFWTDPGISIPAIMRAITTIGSGDVQGGSTITQQYVKILYLSQEKTLTRKLKEIIISLKLGKEQTKEQILEGYLNTVYFGRGAYGVEAAAQAYFGIPISKVNLQQSIVLASVVNAPGLLDPALGDKQKADLLERYQYVINQMVADGSMTAAQKDKIYHSLPKFPAYQRDSRFGGTNGYLMQMALSELRSMGYDDATINGGGLSITTTFDEKNQAAAVAAAQAKVKEVAAIRNKKPDSLHASVVSIDNATGGLLAVYAGGDDWVSQQRNWATTIRPTGSTFKTWVLVAALRQGYSLDTRLKGYTFTAEDGKPIHGETSGMVTLRDATTHSNNAAYVDLTTQLTDGGASAFQAANDAGIPGESGSNGWLADLRVGMGAAEVTPINNASGYSTLANDGVHFPWHVISEVKGADGAVLYAAKPTGTQTIEKDVATEATVALEGVARSGTGAIVSGLGYPVAGKTGTRDIETKNPQTGRSETTAAWFVGYTKQITTAVEFVAGDSGNDDLNNYTWGSFVGGGPPAQTWLAYMRKAMEGLPSVDFTTSDYKPTASPSKTSTSSKPKPSKTRTSTTKPTVAPTGTTPEPTDTSTTTTTTSTTTTTTTSSSTTTTSKPGKSPTP